MTRLPTSLRITLLVTAGCVVIAAGLTPLLLVPDAGPGKVWSTAAPEPLDPAPPPEPEPAPEPEPPPPPVEGVIERAGIVDLSTANTGVYQPGSDADQPVPVDEQRVDAFVTAAASWLDAHLQAFRDGTPRDVPGVTGDPAAVTGAIVGTGDELDQVTYTVRVGARGVPEWAEVVIHLGPADGPADGVVTFVAMDEPDQVVPVAMEAVEAGP